MEVLYYISDCMIPFVILYLVGYGMCKKVDIFDSFIEGAKDGFLTVYKILPTLIGLMIGVGAGFDYFAGNIKRAPQWMQKANLEWLYRLLQDPKRLFKRYFVTNIEFIWNAVIRGK